MNTKYLWGIVILLVLISIWMGLRIGANRDWIAGIFLYVIPAIALTSLTIITLRSKADKKLDAKKNLQTIQEQLEQFKLEFDKLDRVIAELNAIETKIDALEKHFLLQNQPSPPFKNTEDNKL